MVVKGKRGSDAFPFPEMGCDAHTSQFLLPGDGVVNGSDLLCRGVGVDCDVLIANRQAVRYAK